MTPTSSQPPSQPAEPPVDPLGGDLVALLRTLKLSGIKDTLPQRLTLAKTRQLSHYQFLEQVLADEVARREDRSATARALRAGLAPRMRIETWTEPALARPSAALRAAPALRALRVWP